MTRRSRDWKRVELYQANPTDGSARHQPNGNTLVSWGTTGRITEVTRSGRVTFALWLAIALFVVLNDYVGDLWIAPALSVRAVEWYKALVPLPYVAMLAVIHARRTAGPRWLEAALIAALLWPASTVLVDLAYARFTYDAEPAAFFDRFGGPYVLLIAGLFVLPLIAGVLLKRHGLPDREPPARSSS